MRISLIILALGILVASAQAVPTPTPTYSAGISDTCAAPRALSCGDTVYASISSATADDPDSVNDGIRDQWYVLTGPARRASVSTCNGFTNFNTFLEIFTGACSSLSRRAYNDNDAGCSLGGGASNVSWDAFFGVQYRIRVRPKYNTTTTGNYGLTLSCGATLPTPTPTPTPTPAYSGGISDTCAAPRVLNCGNTVYASISSATANDPDSLNDGIRDQWYILTGPAKRASVTTCFGFTNFNTFLEIFTGACSSLSRLAYNDNDAGCSLGGGASNVSWDAFFGVQYRIRVRPKYNTITTGNYGLRLRCGASLPTPTPTPTPTPGYSISISDTCAAPNALSCGDTVYASISSATADDPDSLNDGIRDQWYILTGPARRASVSTCNGFTNFNTFLEIFTGECTSLSRRAYNDNDPGCSLGGGASNVSWDAFFGVQYRIRVRPWSGATTTGNYGLTLSCGATLPTPTPTPTPTPAYSAGISDTCATPRALGCGDTVYASISSATAVDPDSVNDGIRDQWYILTGPARRASVSTCNGFTNFNTFLEIFTGACSSLSRRAYNDNDAGCSLGGGASNVSWDAFFGVQYRIRVRPWSGATTTGNYGLTLSCGATLPTPTPTPTPTPAYSAGISDTCATPRALGCGDTVYASISSATADDPDSVNDGIRDQWYILTGPARRASVSTCNGFTNFNTFLEIFTGACSSLSRRAYNDNDAGCSLGGGASNVSWDAFFGVQYRIRVRPKYNTTTTGNYGLTLSCGATLPTPTPTPTPTPAYSAGISDTCAAPRALNCGNTVYASISSATAVDPDSVNDGIRDQWYILTGPGQRLTATTCNGFTDLNTFLEIYVGACSGLGRLAYNDNDVTCNVPVGASTVSWDGMTGTQYRIRVRPKFNTTTTGNYALTLSCGALL